MPLPIRVFYLSVLLSLCCFTGCSVPETNNAPLSLEAGFYNPPTDCKPRTWFHAMSGNMSKAGLTRDLESMAKVSIGGCLLFNITQGIPNGDVIYDSPEHHEMITHAAKEAERLGLSFGVHNCDGWSSSGGPWIAPEMAMKMVVWSESQAKGGGQVDIDLPQPSSREGYYEDIAVVAYPSLAAEEEDFTVRPRLSASDPDLDLGLVTDGKIDGRDQLRADAAGVNWVQFSYPSPRSIRSAEAVFTDRHATVDLLASDNGRDFRPVRQLFKIRTAKSEWAVNDHFPVVTARHFRLVFNQDVTLKEVNLSAVKRLHNRMGRTALGRTRDQRLTPIGAAADEMIVRSEDLLDLTDQLTAAGNLRADLPPGNWTILRFGQTTTAAENHPASEAGRGLEVDKLSREAFKVHYDAFVGEVVARSRAVAPNALQYAEIDSYEMGGQNWTTGFEDSFREEKGYDLLNYLPLLAGRYVDDTTTSEAVLQDFRSHISNLMTENYYAYFTELCHQDGLLSYVEPYGFGPLNDLDVGGNCDLPMGEFWMDRPQNMIQSAISAAHIYGKPVISAESFTTAPGLNWKGHPALAKLSGDRAWAAGINEFMFHRFAHQANTHVSPGMTMNRWGFHFDRTQTWWYNAGKDWFEYLARGQFLLRQGVPVSDLAVFVGDGAPNGVYQRKDFEPELPNTINYDCINADVLINRLQAKDGLLVLPEGTTYRALVLMNSEKISLPSLRKLVELMEQGVKVIGPMPRHLLQFKPSVKEQATFDSLQHRMTFFIRQIRQWEDLYKKGVTVPDVVIEDRPDLIYAHRKSEEGDIYFLFNPDSIANTFTVDFRITGLAPEGWDPLSGEIYRLTDYQQHRLKTTVNIQLGPRQSLFVVFREAAPDLPAETRLVATDRTQAVTGPWRVTFSESSGYGGQETFSELSDWSQHPKDEVKYYSGTATYRTSFTAPAPATGEKILLDLGEVHLIAEVRLNGKRVGIDWLPPFQLDVTEQLREGENELEIDLTNLWSNRLIGEERYPEHFDGYKIDRVSNGNKTKFRMVDWYKNNEPPPPGQRTTFTTADFYRADDPLLPSGLLGPVQLVVQQIK